MSPASDTPPATAVRLRSLLEQAAELARLLLKSTQPPRELVSRTLHGRKRLNADDRQFISAAAHHALRCWRFSRACATGNSGDVDLRPPAAECNAVVAAAILLAKDGMLPDPALVAIDMVLPEALAEASDSLLLEQPSVAIEELRERARVLDAKVNRLRAGNVRIGSRAVAGNETGWDETGWDETGWDETAAREAFAVRASLPDWVVCSWREQKPALPFDTILDIGMALCAPPPLTVRVNRLRGDRHSLLAQFREAGIDARPHALLSDAIVLSERVPLLDTGWYQDGLFEVQDAGSQLIPLACTVAEGMTVLDACAGGGGKTMQLADLLSDSGSITACDIERSKLRGLEQRAQRLGLRSVHTKLVSPTGSEDVGIGERAYDVVLVDAPCSGFGTVRRNPAHKWRLAEKTVSRLGDRQAEILARYAIAVRPGGALVYATCSLLPQENSEVVARFLETHPSFHPAPLGPATAFAAGDEAALLIKPGVLDSDGFFVAKMISGADDE